MPRLAIGGPAIDTLGTQSTRLARTGSLERVRSGCSRGGPAEMIPGADKRVDCVPNVSIEGPEGRQTWHYGCNFLLGEAILR